DTTYRGHLRLADEALAAGSLPRMRQLLDECLPRPGEPDPRGFEWHHLARASHPESLTLRGHTGNVNGLAFSPDGRRPATAPGDRTVKVWEAATGRELLTLKGHRGVVWDVGFSQDGARLASASADGTARLWDAHTGAESLRLEGHAGAVFRVAFAPDG